MKYNFRYDASRYNSEYRQRIQECIEFILDKKYGDTIDIEDVAHILHYNIEDVKEFKKFKSTFTRIRNILIDYGYILKSIPGIGYYILKPKQISGYCYHTYIRRTENLLDKSSRILLRVDTSQLSNERIEEHKEVKELNLDLMNNIAQTIENSKYYDKKEYYDNLKD